MEIISSVLSVVSSLALSLSLGTQLGSTSSKEGSGFKQQAIYAAALKCKAGFKKGKTPVLLVPGAKLACVDAMLVSGGKRILTKGTCGTCHAQSGIAPYSLTNSKLYAQLYNLKPASLKSAFNAHAAEMAGSTVKSAQLKSISAFLQTLAPPF